MINEDAKKMLNEHHISNYCSNCCSYVNVLKVPYYGDRNPKYRYIISCSCGRKNQEVIVDKEDK